MLTSPNPDGRSNAQVVLPWMNGLDLYGRPRRMWIIDFGTNMAYDQAVLYEKPFEYVKAHVLPARRQSRTTIAEWWLHERRRGDMRRALQGLKRFLATVRHSKHRIFAWIPQGTLPDSALIVFARDDDYFFGVLHSRPHELWARGLGTQVREVETGFRYTPTTTFETFPMPHPAPEAAEVVAAAAQELDRLRQGWLNPPDADAALLRQRTLTNLYNQRPTWLDQAHKRLDEAVHAAYGWPYPLGDEEILERLIALNLRRADRQGEMASINQRV